MLSLNFDILRQRAQSKSGIFRPYDLGCGQFRMFRKLPGDSYTGI